MNEFSLRDSDSLSLCVFVKKNAISGVCVSTKSACDFIALSIRP